MFRNPVVDLSNAVGISDFVHIEVNHMGWIALRKDGTVHYQFHAVENGCE
jgi:hypothetical protein